MTDRLTAINDADWALRCAGAALSRATRAMAEKDNAKFSDEIQRAKTQIAIASRDLDSISG